MAVNRNFQDSMTEKLAYFRNYDIDSNQIYTKITRMWANCQRDGRPAEYRWRPLFNAAKSDWCPLLECRAVTPPRRETRWNLQGCPKLANRSKPLVRQFTILSWHVEEVLLFNTRFPIVDTCLSSEDISGQSCTMVPKWRFFASCNSASRVQHISYLHSKFTLRRHHVSKYGRHPICGCLD